MMKKILFFTFFVHCFIILRAQEIEVNDSSRISLITCSPGPEIYAQFGHTAIRYVDPAKRIDLMFNYGIFNFNKPGFYLNFVKGFTDYELGVYDSAYFFPEYKERNSQVTEQVLNLSLEEKKDLMRELMTNYQPENREYRYNFIFDNCSTRPRDKIEKIIFGEITYTPYGSRHTFRDWIGYYVGNASWTKFGIDLLLGKETDRLAKRSEAMFLPEILMKEFAVAKVKAPDKTIRPLVKEQRVIVPKQETVQEKTSIVFLPWFVSLFVLLFGLFITYSEFVKKRNWIATDSVLLLLTGFVGIIIFYLMFFSVHPLVRSNYNILWCNPLNLLLGIALWMKKCRKCVFFFQMANVLLFLGALIVSWLSVQKLNVAFIPLIWLLLARSAFWLYKERFLLLPGPTTP